MVGSTLGLGVNQNPPFFGSAALSVALPKNAGELLLIP